MNSINQIVKLNSDTSFSISSTDSKTLTLFKLRRILPFLGTCSLFIAFNVFWPTSSGSTNLTSSSSIFSSVFATNILLSSIISFSVKSISALITRLVFGGFTLYWQFDPKKSSLHKQLGWLIIPWNFPRSTQKPLLRQTGSSSTPNVFEYCWLHCMNS